MDYLRSCYRSSMRPYPDRPDIVVPGCWHWSPAGARPVPYMHAFGSSVWDDYHSPVSPPVGEQAPRGEWVPGGTGEGVDGRPHGLEADWTARNPYNPLRVGVVYPGCSPPPCEEPGCGPMGECVAAPCDGTATFTFNPDGDQWTFAVTWRAPDETDPPGTNGVYEGESEVTWPVPLTVRCLIRAGFGDIFLTWGVEIPDAVGGGGFLAPLVCGPPLTAGSTLNSPIRYGPGIGDVVSTDTIEFSAG